MRPFFHARGLPLVQVDPALDVDVLGANKEQHREVLRERHRADCFEVGGRVVYLVEQRRRGCVLRGTNCPYQVISAASAFVATALTVAAVPRHSSGIATIMAIVMRVTLRNFRMELISLLSVLLEPARLQFRPSFEDLRRRQ